jgi:hypothetical protein
MEELMKEETLKLLLPVGRFVFGSLYEASDKDFQGNPLKYSNGPKAGEQRFDFWFKLAIEKKPGHTHWAQTTWGSQIYNKGVKEWPSGEANKDNFAWKIHDGNSTEVNSKDRKLCDYEGYPGNWILHINSCFAPKIYDRLGEAQLIEKDHVKLGDYIQVFCEIKSNNTKVNPGIYITHLAVAFAGHGDPIVIYNIDPKSVGFGQDPDVPRGLSTVPVTKFNPAGVPQAPGAPVVQQAPQATTIVTPYPQVLNVPQQPMVTPQYTPPAQQIAPSLQPPAPPAAPAQTQRERIMLPAAGTFTYEQYLQSGWTDDSLIASGKMQYL